MNDFQTRHPPADRNAGALRPASGAPAGDEPGRAPPGVLLLEIGWEVCNPVGGIHQVLRSKASTMTARWANRYVLVGPYTASGSAVEFEPRKPSGWAARVVADLEARGIGAHYGQWLIAGRPRVILLEQAFPVQMINAIKAELWEHHKLESPTNDALCDGVVGFAHAVRELLAALTRARGAVEEPVRVLAHFHEWLGGLAIPMVRRLNLPVATVFTTHATLLGRYVASSDQDFYGKLRSLDHEAEAWRFAVRPQHHYERACAHGAHIFTTISPITAEECRVLLGREPDKILPNGLNIDRYNVGHEFQTLHAVFKERIHQFMMGHFFPSYPMDLERTLYFFTSGRYEPRNKGFDLCLEACARLNELLARHGLDMNVVLFIITRRPTRWLAPDALHRRGVLNELREVCERITGDIGDKLFRHAAAGERVSLDGLMEEYWSLRLRRTQAALKTDAAPPALTHVLENEHDDEVLAALNRLGLRNGPEDRVKIVYHPDFINPTNPLWGMEYEQFVRGCHLGVFPSAYEPWGYTPQECIALGVPAVTSDLAGFGRYVAQGRPEGEGWGPWILPRRGRTMEQAADHLARRMLEFCALDRRGRIGLRNEVERRSWSFDWSRLARPYHEAHDAALARARAEAV